MTRIQHEACSSLIAILMLPCFHHDLYRTLCPRCAFFLLPFFLFFSSFDFVFYHSQRRFLSRSAKMSGFLPPLFLTCSQRPSRSSCLPLPANVPSLILIGSPISQPIVCGESSNLNLQSKSPWFLLNRTWLRLGRPGELDHRLRFENEEMTLQMK